MLELHKIWFAANLWKNIFLEWLGCSRSKILWGNLITPSRLKDNLTARIPDVQIHNWNPYHPSWGYCSRWPYFQKQTQSPPGVHLPAAAEGPVAPSILHRDEEGREWAAFPSLTIPANMNREAAECRSSRSAAPPLCWRLLVLYLWIDLLQ